MAAITVTAAQVGFKGTSVPVVSNVLAGEQIDPGEVVYRSTDNKYYKAVATSAVTSGSTSGDLGIAIGYTSGADIYVTVALNGSRVHLGGAASSGVQYVLGDAVDGAGTVVPNVDLAAGDFVTYVGTGNSDGSITLKFNATGNSV